MGVRIIGWGKWGGQVLHKMPPIPWINAMISIDEGKYSETGVFVDPLAAETWYSRPPFIDVEETTFSLEQKKFKAAKTNEAFRIHVVHAADHFATGCISAFLRTKEDAGTDALVLLLPQIGVNEPTVGRILAEVYGLKKFTDITILIDASAPQFALMDEGVFTEKAASVIRLLLCMERSVCGIQILEQMLAKTFSFSIQPIKIITQACSLEPLWLNCSVEKSFGMAPGKAWLSVSVSNRRESYLPRIILSNLDRKNAVYLPFLNKYEWKEATAHAEPFVGVFCADHLPTTLLRWLRSYKKYYFPEKDRKVELSSSETERWLATHFIQQHWQPLTSDVAGNAMKFCKENFLEKRGE